MKRCVVTVGLVLAVGSSVSLAGDFMSGRDLQKVLCGNTFQGENLAQGSTFRVYYPEKCDEVVHRFLTGSNAGKTVTWSFRISPSGDHCVAHDGKELCTRFVALGDGVYHGMRDGKAVYTRSNGEAGKHLGD